ncbi:hypothetical protein Tco_1303239 [Tanacetum coccineum]
MPLYSQLEGTGSSEDTQDRVGPKVRVWSADPPQGPLIRFRIGSGNVACDRAVGEAISSRGCLIGPLTSSSEAYGILHGRN